MPRFRFQRVRLATALFGVTLLLVGFHSLGWLSPFENVFRRLLAPIQARFFEVGTVINESFEGQAKPLTQTEITQLQTEHAQLTVENAQLRSLLADYRQFDEQIDFLSENGLEAIAARVIGRSVEPELRIISLNVGQRDGVEVGAPVIIGQGVLVAVITSTSSVDSDALLLNDSQSKISAAIQDDEQTAGVIEGEHGLSLRMQLIPQSVEVRAGQVVVSSGIETGIPRGLVIGTVNRLETSANAFFQSADVRPMVDYNDLTVVSVLTRTQDD